MAEQETTWATEPVGRVRPSGAARAVTVLAVLAGLLSIARFIQWGNRWYVTEAFAREGAGADAASWEWRYQLLHGAHDALVGALVWLVVVLVLVGVLWGLRRRDAARG
ncbi:MAG TPA: hypothetical protein PLU22_16890 [Polyangiaceae bacterium]|nr:hypothetical protein [Polyangiaceae bacterium]